MRIKRRSILKATAAAGALSVLQPSHLFADGHRSAAALNILFLGGTGFIGPHMVREALARGHNVTLFNRGRRNRDLFPELELLVGDRNSEYEALEGKTWDVVIDTSGYIPRHVEESASILSEAVNHYLFISTVAVYAEHKGKIAVTDALATLDDPTIEQVTGETYGALKAYCEGKVLDHFPERHTILRPTYICGPGDHLDRFIYYIDQPMHSERVPVPGPQDAPISYVDVRDLAQFTIRALENKVFGVFNMANFPGEATISDLMHHSLKASGSESEIVYIPPAFLEAQGLEGGFPMFPNPAEYSPRYDIDAALSHGLHQSPLSSTVQATYDWWQSQPIARHHSMRKVLPLDTQRKWLAAYEERA